MKRAIPVLWVIMVLIILYAPLCILAFYSFTDVSAIGATGHFSLENYITLFSSEELRSMIMDTLVLAGAVSVLATILGTLGAIGSFYSKARVNRTIGMVNQVPVINADVVTGFSICILMLAIFQVHKESYIPLVAGLTSLCAPFCYLSVMPRLQQMNHELYEAALDLGCTERQALFKIVIPQIIPGILSGFMMSFTLTLDDYFITTYTKPAVFNTISTYVVNATKGAQTEIKTALWALSTVMFLLVVVIVLCMNRKHKIGGVGR